MKIFNRCVGNTVSQKKVVICIQFLLLIKYFYQCEGGLNVFICVDEEGMIYGIIFKFYDNLISIK